MKKSVFVRKTTLLAFLLLILACSIISAGEKGNYKGELRLPEEGVTQIIISRGGSQMMGRILEIKDDEVVFQSELGTTDIKISDIKEIREIASSSLKEGTYWFPNPNQTRMFLSPTGRMLRKGEGYFNDIYIFFPSVAYGITDNITMGAGITIIPGIDIDKQIMYFTPKIGVAAVENFSLAVSGLIFRIPKAYDWDNDDAMAVGIIFGTGTYGTPDKSISFGLGYGFVDDELADKPAVMVGGEYRFARRAAFVSENWVFPGTDNPLISYGVRLFGEQMSIDLGFFNTFGEDMPAIGFPIIDFVYNF
ncbi:MAG: hypothetical protein CVT49_06385 [candidate division Zixibacteria bacterium HGW-Zixibacteria-1]|nr:MAG: hypothetical protein CVT49_06385 [candidate division Zixibacteria bacterium HGW-Zixibacteria-1]